MQGLQAYYGLDGDNLWQAATGFGGGIGRAQGLCGAVSGGVLATSIAMAKRGGGVDYVRDRTYRAVKDAYHRFLAEFGSTECRVLTGFDFAEPDGFRAFQTSGAKDQKCAHYVGYVVRTLALPEEARPTSASNEDS